MSKKYNRLGSLALVWQPVLEMENADFKQTVLHCKTLSVMKKLGEYTKLFN